MPHLQDESEDKSRQEKQPGDAVGSSSRDLDSTAELPIQEAKKGYLGTSDPIVSALARKVSTVANKVESFESTEASACSPPASRTSKPVTPSSLSSNGRVESLPRSVSNNDGPFLTLFGDNSITPSPIRVKRRVSQSEEDEDDHIVMSQPTHLRLSGPHGVTHAGKRCVSSDQDNCSDNNSSGAGEGSPRKAIKKLKGDHLSQSVEAAKGSSPTGDLKKRTVSPTSSGEKGDDDDHTETSGQPYLHFNPYEKSFHGHASAHYHPHPPAFAFGGIPPYGVGYPIYHGYPPPRLPYGAPMAMGHLHGGHPGAPGFFPPYPHAAHMMHHPRHLYPPFPSHHRMGGPIPPKGNEAGTVETSMDPKVEGRGKSKKDPFKSVTDWQQQPTMSAGKPPSANRCVPLKEPFPSKYWGEGDKTKDVTLPDFHRLVNYPDYLTKSRNGSSDMPPGCSDGKKSCVMCGKLRICSATSLINKGRAMTDDEYINAADRDSDCAHIIPRQNKGLCTACDVTVWMVVATGLEIKWCKGCKNFRPWAAFGDKGGATKCVRCRDRQREKYALQKDVVKPRKFKVGGSNSSFTSSSSEEREEESNVADAARGLRNLMNAAAAAAV